MHPILLTIDVEDWFQVENFKQRIPFSSWSSCELRVEKNTHRLLDLLDSQQSAVSSQQLTSTNPIQNSKFKIQNSIKATFFVLGWIAERLPNLVREIQSRGHEVASHGYYHNLCNHQSAEDLRKDLIDSKEILEDITGAPVTGYRAPNFSINNEALKIIEDCGYLYDSSYNSFASHERYGQVDLKGYPRKGIAIKLSDNFYELPISNLKLFKWLDSFKTIQNSKFKIQNLIFPWGGGGYFRLIPLFIFSAGVRFILKKEGAYLFYMHPWEIDPEQPKVSEAPVFYRFRHYVNLKKTCSKLTGLLRSLDKCRFVTCSQYLDIR
jgi:polysaccharide deacetylase family protein (PEP-CTERM system associated)